MVVVAAALLPLSVAWALSSNDSAAEAGAAPSPGVTAPDPGLMSALDEGTQEPVAAKRTPRTKDRLAALRHPLEGATRAELIRTIGRPTRRTTEGGPTLELLEYNIADDEYQVVILDKRVIEVIRFR